MNRRKRRPNRPADRRAGRSSPRMPERSPGDIEWHFLEARRLMDAGKIRAAMEQAGFGVRLDLARADGYMLLGELNLLDGDLLEARRSFAAAAGRSRGETRVAALAGEAQVSWLAGDLSEARSFYEGALKEDPDDPLNLRPALVELLLETGDVASAKKELERCEDASPDVFLLAALIHAKERDLIAAIVSVRRAALENVYLPAALLEQEPPALGLVHGLEEATPEHAHALVERLAPLFRKDQASRAFLAAAIDTKAARREREELVALAKRLQAEGGASARGGLKRDLAALRDPGRIAASAPAVLEELRRDQPCALPPFDV